MRSAVRSPWLVLGGSRTRTARPASHGQLAPEGASLTGLGGHQKRTSYGAGDGSFRLGQHGQARNSRFDSRNSFFPIGSAAPPRSIIAWKSRRRKCVCEERSTEKLGVRRPSGFRSGESVSKRRQTAHICGAG